MRKKIFIDCGHNYSGADTGSQGNGLREQDVTYKVGKILSELLKVSGFDVKMSRENLTDNIGKSENESLHTRAKMANDWKADCFVSLHCDSTINQLAKGCHGIIYKEGGQAEKLARSIVDELYKLNLDGRSELIEERPKYPVLYATNMTACIIEMGFISNPDNAEIMRKPEVLATAIHKGILSYFNINTQKEIESVNDIVWELASRGIITDKALWLKKLEEDKNVYWLCKKTIDYLIKKGV